MSEKNSSTQTEKYLLIILSIISVGLLVAIVYVWYSALANKPQPSQPGDFLKEESESLPEASLTPPEASPSAQNPPPPVTLFLISPSPEEVTRSETISVTGKSLPRATVVVESGVDEAVGQADDEGQFEEKIGLDEGENKVTVTVFDENGNQNSQTLSVIYLP